MTGEMLSNFILRPHQLDHMTGAGYNSHRGYSFHKRLN